jgi:hypothetical protein
LSEPIRAEWASGRRKASIDLVLLLSGLACLMLSLVVGFQIAVEPRWGDGLGKLVILIPAWALIAVILAFVLRRRKSNLLLKSVGIIWLFAGVALLVFSPNA